MSYISLYRKYRPKAFKDVVGQKYILQILKNSISNNQIANAYVFAGTKGTGKTTIAKIFANAINCLDNKDGDVCSCCEICKDFLNNQTVDIVELDGASNNGVDEVRQIIESAAFLPSKFRKKVYIIDEAHMLTNQAWNALLKLIEEPPVHVVFIFATTEIHRIPATILSRCLCFKFSKISNSDMVDLLTKVCRNENFEFESSALKLIAEVADGSARDALSILEQVGSYGKGSIKTNDIYKIFGLLSPVQMVDFLNLLISKNDNEVFKKLNEFFQSGINFLIFVKLLVSILTDKLIYLKTKDYSLLSKNSGAIISSVQLDNISQLISLIDVWQEIYFKITTPTDVNILITNAIIKSLSILDGNIQLTKNMNIEMTKPNKEVKKENTKTKAQTINSQPILNNTKDTQERELFKYWDVKIKNQNVEEKKESEYSKISQPKNEIKLPSIHEILLSIFANKEDIFLQQAIKVLEDIKSGKNDEKSFSQAANASTVLFASPNGIVLLFDDAIDAKLFNDGVNDQDFILACCKYFRCPKFVIGCTKEELMTSKDEMLKARKNKKPLLNVDILRDILNGKPSIEQIAYNEIYSHLKLEDRK